ncbi:unnamed protein product [Clonostachys rosea]|uniref:FAR-17a/AIG1-like protein n=1 Tax=Bionectria ochroleuca TaxID=29856 RepID=A0ABY6ULC5_BIOOC|nr:unnamed protein product [Clonostachys rosea]
MRYKAFSFGSDPWDPSNRFVSSWLLSPWLLFAGRLLIGLYALATRLYSIVWRCTHDDCASAGRSFPSLTVQTYWGIVCYFLVASVHTGYYAFHGRSLLQRLCRPLQAMHALFYSTIVTLPLLVTIVYWGILFDGYPLDNEGGHHSATFVIWDDVSHHAVNGAFALFEIVIPRTAPMLWVHAFWLLIILALYIGLAFLTLATQGFYMYPFLDYRAVGGRAMVAAYLIGFAAGAVLVFCAVQAVIWFRRWATETKLGLNGKAAEMAGRSHDLS